MYSKPLIEFNQSLQLNDKTKNSQAITQGANSSVQAAATSLSILQQSTGGRRRQSPRLGWPSKNASQQQGRRGCMIGRCVWCYCVVLLCGAQPDLSPKQ